MPVYINLTVQYKIRGGATNLLIFLSYIFFCDIGYSPRFFPCIHGRGKSRIFILLLTFSLHLLLYIIPLPADITAGNIIGRRAVTKKRY